MKIALALLLATRFASASVTELNPETTVQQLRLLDRVSSANFLLETFGVETGSKSRATEAVRRFVYSQYPFFSGPCFPSQDSFCPDRTGMYETTPKHSSIREGYKMQACGSLAGDPKLVNASLEKAGLTSSADLSPENLRVVLSQFFPGRAKEMEIEKTSAAMRELQQKDGTKRAWSQFLMLVCSSVGWQAD